MNVNGEFILPDLDKICEEVEFEWGAYGLTDGFYDLYAKEVAKKYALLILTSNNVCSNEIKNIISELQR